MDVGNGVEDIGGCRCAGHPRLAKLEPRISAAVLFAGSFVPRSMFEEARQVTLSLQLDAGAQFFAGI